MTTKLAKMMAVALAFTGACGAANAGELNIVGTGDGLEMLRMVAVEHAALHPDVKISIPPSIGSSGGVVAVGSDTERLGRVARPLKDTEIKYGLVYIPIAKIPSAIIVHPSSKVTDLTTEQVVGIFSGKIESWAEVGGPDLKIKVVRREEADSTLSVMREQMPGWKDLEFTARSKTAVTTQDAIDTVRQVAGTIGFGPFSRAIEFDTNVIKIDGKFPTDLDYPSSVEFALIYKKEKLDSEMKSFVDFCLSDKATRVIELYGGVRVRQ
jgi:phosphate transport system substrate-binding protein